MVSDAVRAFLNSNIIKDNPRMRSADFDFAEYRELSAEEHQRIEGILLSKLYVGHDARVLLALAELGTERAIVPLQNFIVRIREENGISADGLIYQATVALWQISQNPSWVVGNFIALLQGARMGMARREAAIMLANFNTPDVHTALADALEDSQGSVRKQAALSLAQMYDMELDDDLVEAIRKNDADGRRRFLEQIG